MKLKKDIWAIGSMALKQTARIEKKMESGELDREDNEYFAGYYAGLRDLANWVIGGREEDKGFTTFDIDDDIKKQYIDVLPYMESIPSHIG